MAQAALKTETETSPFVVAFGAALARVTDIQSVLAFAKTDMKDTMKTMRDAMRGAAWAAFDLVQQGEDGEALALQIADARAIEGKSRNVYAMRGRDLTTFAKDVAKAPRETADPFTIVKKLRAARDGKLNEQAAAAIHMAEAREIAMGVLEMTPSAFDAELISVNGQAAREALAEAMNLCQRRGEVLNNARDLALILANADDATKAKAKEIFACLG